MKPEVRIIKKYQNRRLYDIATSSYIVLDRIKQIIIEGEPVKVIDAKTNEDVTRAVLLQIILSEEINGVPLFTDDFLINVIGLYGKYIKFSLSPFLMYGLNLSKKMQKEFYDKVHESYKTDNVGLDFWNNYIKMQPQFIESSIKDFIESNTNFFIQFQDEIRKQTFNVFDCMNFPFKFKEKK